MYTFYGYDDNPRTEIVRIVAAAEGIKLSQYTVIPRKNVGLDVHLSKFPLSQGKIPALEAPGLAIAETPAIATYLAQLGEKKRLLSDGSLEQQAEVLSWVNWANPELLVTLSAWFLPLIPNLDRPAPCDYNVIEIGKNASLEILDRLEKVIAGKNYLVGLQWVLDTQWREQHPKIIGHVRI